MYEMLHVTCNRLLISRFPNSNQSNKNLERLHILGVDCSGICLAFALTRNVQVNRFCSRDGCYVTKTEKLQKLECHQNRNVTRTEM